MASLRCALPVAALLCAGAVLPLSASAQTAPASAPAPSESAAPGSTATIPAASTPAPPASPAPSYTSRLLYTRQAPPPAAPTAPAADAIAAPSDAGIASLPGEDPSARTPGASSDYLGRMDRDGDGRVALGEYQDWLSYAFDRMDRDGDGVLGPGEQPGGRGDALTRDAHRARIAERFRLQDRDRDGSLDARELAAPPQGR